MDSIPKLCGGDIELANFILGSNRRHGSGSQAVRAVLPRFEAVSASQGSGWWGGAWEDSPYRPSGGSSGRSGSSYFDYVGQDWEWGGYRDGGHYNPQDIGRRFLPSNGGCVYEDLSHLELCLPEVLSARDWIACWHAMLSLTMDAQTAANDLQSQDRPIQILANNSDGLGSSYGGHIDLLVTREVWDNLMHRRLHYLAYLVAFQVSGIVITGQGKVGSENGAPPVAFQITQRGDFFETILGQQTTHRRPLVNSRDEPLCGSVSAHGQVPPGGALPTEAARLHSIFADTTLCHVSSLLRIGTLQILLCMLESGRLDPSLALDDPLEALTRWGHDPTLEARARLASGEQVTAVELQERFHEEASSFVQEGGCEEKVPGAGEIIELWGDVLRWLKEGDLPSLFGKLDWVTKQMLLQESLRSSPQLGWGSPEIKYLDHLYSSLPDGLFFNLDRDGLVERLVSDEEIRRFTQSPPEDTRAWGRSLLLGMGDPERISAVDWDGIRFRKKRKRWDYGGGVKVEMPNPLGWTREAVETAVGGSPTLDEILETFGTGTAAITESTGSTTIVRRGI